MHKTHRRPLSSMILLACAAAICLLTAAPAATAEGERPKLEQSDLKKLRKQAANRPPADRLQRRRLSRCCPLANHSPKSWLACARQTGGRHPSRHHLLLHRAVVVCFGHISPKSARFWASWVAEEGNGPYVKHMRDGPYRHEGERHRSACGQVIDYSHKNKMEVFWSYRMNNPECSFVSWALSQRKRNHPEYIMGEKADWKKYPLTDPKAWWTLSDFERAEVRDHIVRIFEDVCQRYDIDGVELDFIRHPLLFRPNLEGKPVEPRHVEMMTEMLRRIRAVTERGIAQTGTSHPSVGPRSPEREKLPGYRARHWRLSRRRPDRHSDCRPGLHPDGGRLVVERHG